MSSVYVLENNKPTYEVTNALPIDFSDYEGGDASDEYTYSEVSGQYYKPIYYDTLIPYQVAPHNGIQYLVCRDFNHISRYKGLRQLAHNPNSLDDRFITLETPNDISSEAAVDYYKVPAKYENRLDLIANKFLGSAQYKWVICYMNNIEDGFTVREGQVLKIIKNFTDLFNKGEILASIPPLTLNLGIE